VQEKAEVLIHLAEVANRHKCHFLF